MESRDKKALFLLPTVDQTSARHFTHIELFSRTGYECQVAAFFRGKKEGNVYLDKVDTKLGRIKHGQYLRRLPIYLHAISKIKQNIDESDVACCYTLDSFFLLWIAACLTKNKVKVVFFLLDVREVLLGARLKNKLVRGLLRFAFKHSDMVVVSSSAFIEEFATQMLQYVPDRWVEIENKVNVDQLPESSNPNSDRKAISSKKIIIGYFGLIRCARSIELLGELVSRWPNKFAVVMSGVYLDVDEQKAKMHSISGVDVCGPYRNPEDLAQVYSSCDVVWGCYPYSALSTGNHQWAKTNRFYEACYFKKPLIVAGGTLDAIEVERYGIGKILDLGDIEGALAMLVEIEPANVLTWQNRVDGLPLSVSTYKHEFADLALQLR